MKKRILFACISLALAIGMTGCATTPKTAAQSVYAEEASLTAAMQVATQYASLPSCPQSTLCSDPATVQRILDAAQLAVSATQAAQTLVTQGATAASIQAALSLATTDVSALIDLTSKVKTQ